MNSSFITLRPDQMPHSVEFDLAYVVQEVSFYKCFKDRGQYRRTLHGCFL